MGSNLRGSRGGKSGADASTFVGTGIKFSYGKPRKFIKDSRCKHGPVIVIKPPNATDRGIVG